MSVQATGSPGGVNAGDDAAARLRSACRQLEGVFLQQLLKALRETVPEGGAIDGGAAEDIFSSLLDGHLAGAASERLDSGLADALYRQLRGDPASPEPAPASGADVA